MLVGFNPSLSTPSVNRKNPDRTSFQNTQLTGTLSSVILNSSSDISQVRKLLVAIQKNKVIIDKDALITVAARINELENTGHNHAAGALRKYFNITY